MTTQTQDPKAPAALSARRVRLQAKFFMRNIFRISFFTSGFCGGADSYPSCKYLCTGILRVPLTFFVLRDLRLEPAFMASAHAVACEVL